ncbi:hypothetical protein K440DRAFT_678009 [Wilcoxina mikolae CBS 423.85]|nr:hypothetical protein K440DRAFT_678009 [Wilcoxina mikolae CBS 423.85]
MFQGLADLVFGYSNAMNPEFEEMAVRAQEQEYESRPVNGGIDIGESGGHSGGGENGDPRLLATVQQQQLQETVQCEKHHGIQQGNLVQTHETLLKIRMSSTENGRSTTSSARHSSQGQSKSQQGPSGRQRGSDRGYSGRGQVIYINGREELVQSPDGKLYTEEQLRFHEYYLQHIENNYVHKDKFDKRDQDYHALHRLYQQDKKLFVSLQEDMLSRVDRYQPKSDSEIRQEFDNVKLAISGMSNILAPKVAPEVLRERLGRLALSANMDDKVWQSNQRRNGKMLVESFMWMELYQLLLKDPFKVYSSSTCYMESWTELFEEGPDGDFYPTPTEMSEQWRVTTANALMALCTKKPQPTTQAVAMDVLHSLESKLKQIGYEKQQHKEDLKYIIKSARMLARTLSTQKARLRLFLPVVGEHFSKRGDCSHKLEPANRFGDELESGEVLFVVMPGLRKWGDGNGHALETVSDMIAARVLISE